MDIANILTYLRPGETWSLNGDSYDGLVWLSDTKKPTLQEIEDYYSTYVTLRDEKLFKEKVKKLLVESDWAELPTSQSLLNNAEEWMTYRNILKQIFIARSGEIPIKPEAIWL